MSFDFCQSFDGRSARSSCREEGDVAVGDFAPDQKTTRPFLTDERFVVVAAIEIGEFEIGPIVKSLAFGWPRPKMACCRHGPGSPAASARIQPVLRRSLPSKASRKLRRQRHPRLRDSGRIRPFTSRSDDAHSSNVVSIDAPDIP